MPIPNPKDGESKDDYIGRCMADSKMNEEYPEQDQRAAVCNTTWEGSAGEESVTLTEEIFAVGTWNGLQFEIEDLNLIAAAFHSLGDNHQVPLKLGHNDEQPFTDGQPALGWVTDVWVEGSKLMAKFEDVPKIVAKAIEKKLYRNKSIELDMGVEHKGEYYFWVLSGVALLGADIPAVNTLNDLGTLMSKGTDALRFKKRVTFTVTNEDMDNGRNNMPDPNIQQELDTLKKKFSALETEHQKLIDENRSLKTKNEELRIEFKATEEAEKHRKQLEQRSDLEKQLDTMVKEKQIAPFSRDDFMRDYDQADDNGKNQVVFSVDKLKKTIESNPAYFGAEQARNKAQRDKQEEELDASQVVVNRTREYMSKHGEKNFSAAKLAVLKADPELANRYAKGEG